jgi:hypothetical protein
VRLPAPQDLRGRLEETDQLVRALRLPAQDAGPGLRDHLRRPRQHHLEHRGCPRRHPPRGQWHRIELRCRGRSTRRCLADHLSRDPQQPAIRPLERRGRGLAPPPHGLPDLPPPTAHTATHIVHLPRHREPRLPQPAHRAAQYAHGIGAQPAVGRVADGRLDDRGIDPQSPAIRYAPLDGDRHDACQDLAQHGPREELAQAHERLGVGNRPARHAAEMPVGHAAPHLPLELLIAQHTWALGEAVQWSNASGDVSTATAFRLGRMCDPATHQCAP